MLELASDTPLSRERTMGVLVEDSVLGARAAAMLLLGFGVLALLLGSIGTYGLVAVRRPSCGSCCATVPAWPRSGW